MKSIATAVDTSPIANKKSRKRKILDDSDEEDDSIANSMPITNNITSSNSPPASNNAVDTVSDVDLPCSSASLQQSPNVLSTPPKRLTGILYNIVCVCLSVCLSVCLCACVH